MEFKDFYQIMGVSADASAAEIKSAYKKLARKYHPDVSSEENAQEKFKELGEAYDVLKDPKKRDEYDQLRTHVTSEQGFNSSGRYQFDPNTFGDAGFNFEDLIKSIFGEPDFANTDTFHQNFTDKGYSQKGRDVRYKLRITAEEAFHGGDRQINLSDSGMSSKKKSRRINVKIPAGITNAKELRLKGQGESGIGGGPKGDLYLEIEIAPHPLFALQGKDVTIILPVTPWEAALGAKLEVPTLGGRVNLSIPENSQNGNKLRLKSKGLPGHPAGDQYVILKILNPDIKTDEEKVLFRKMQQAFDFDPRKEKVIR